ncbi:MAG TPA: hypothetical protein VJU61_22600 [Polyangiaceae bacterium]|nr:hypothetical protein [Polyangiaceae bacterium]
MLLPRSTFLTLASVVALAIGAFAIVLPQQFLLGKGVAVPNLAAAVWMRELGVSILALGVILFWVRRHADSATLRAVLWGNALVQLGLLATELVAYRERVIPLVSGILPNSVLHVVLASGFLAYAARPRGLE